MKITFVQSDTEIFEMRDAIERREPRGVYVVPPVLSGDLTFTVVDNSDGNAWTESFNTIDGALLYALGIKSDVEKKDDPVLGWDRHGALKDWGNFV